MSTSLAEATSVPRGARAPILALLLLSPVIAEVLYGATRLSVIFVLVPEILTWGCGTLLIREVILRWKKGWPSRLILGVAFAVAEECLIQQTSLAPMVGLAKSAYGRVWGVNWVYFLWALGYESVWVVIIPIQLVELLYPSHRAQTWLRPFGIFRASMAFAGGSFGAWYGWTQRARVQVFHLPPYDPPPLYLILSLAVVLLLILAARLWPNRRPEGVPHNAPRAWMVGLVCGAFGTPWSAFVLIGYGSVPEVPPAAALAVGLVWAASIFFLVWRWSAAANWSDSHRMAMVVGGVVACVLGGFLLFRVAGALQIDWIGKVVFDVIGLIWLITMARRRRFRRPVHAMTHHP